VPIGAPLHLVGGSIGVSFGASSTGLNEMDLEIAEDVGAGDPVGAILASATISDLPPPSAGRRYDTRDASAPGATSEQQSPGSVTNAPWRLANRSPAARIDQYGW
jgi:hypothetical protein